MTAPSPSPVAVTWDELQTPEVSARVEQLRAAGAPPLVRAVGAPASASSKWFRNGIVTLGLAGLVGGLLGWALSEVMTNTRADERTDATVSHWYGSSPMAGSIVFTVFIALGIGGVLASWEGIEARSLRKVWRRLSVALPVLAVGGVLGGFLAQKLFVSRMQATYTAAKAYLDTTGDLAGAQAQVDSAIHLTRALAFALFAVAAGLALGAASRSGKQALNGAIGGFVGGGVGGYLFDYVNIGNSGVASRLVALTICGTVIGVAVGLVEHVRKDTWLEIVSGGMAGKQFILYNAQTSIGSGPSCDITLIKDPQIVDRHLTIERTGSGVTATAITAGVPFLLNGQPVLSAGLGDSDTLQVGSTVLRLRERSAAAPVAGAIIG